jgi:hypothetical protein
LRSLASGALLVVPLVLLQPSGVTAHAAPRAITVLTSGSVGIRLVDVPTSAAGDPRARLYIVDQLAPGTVIHRRIAITVTAATPVPVALYAAAATITGDTFTPAAARTQNDVSTWTTVTPAAVDVTSKHEVIATVTVAVPSDAAPGERYGVVWAEVSSSPSRTTGIVEVNRVGIRMYVSVGPGGAPAPNFMIDSLTAARSATGAPMVLAQVHNTGGRALDLSGAMTLSNGPGGLSGGPFPVTLGVTLAPGTTEPVTVALDKQLPNGPWTAHLTLRSGLVERTASAVISFPAVGAAAPVPVQSAGVDWPLIVIGIGTLVLIGALIWWLVTRRRHVRPLPH